MRILLIEDDEDLCRSLDVQLKHAGYTVDICMDGEDASYYTAKSIHDVILLRPDAAPCRRAYHFKKTP